MSLTKKQRRKLKKKMRREKRLRLKLAKTSVIHSTCWEYNQGLRQFPCCVACPACNCHKKEEEIPKPIEEIQPEPLETPAKFPEAKVEEIKIKENNMNFFKGYLTYTLALIAILWGIIGWIFEWIAPEIALNTIWIGLAAFGIRRALK